MPLIGRDDPAPFVVLQEHGRPRRWSSATTPAGPFRTALDRLGLPELPSWQHIAWDIGAGELARGLAHALDAPAVLAGYSRLVVDCNRSPDDLEAFRTESDGWAIPGNQDLTEYDRRLRLAFVLRPLPRVHRRDAGRASARRGTVPLIIAVHSFSPALAGVTRPVARRRALGPRRSRTRDACSRACARSRAWSSATTSPTAASTPPITRSTTTPRRSGLPHVCIEVRQDLLEFARRRRALGAPAGAHRRRRSWPIPQSRELLATGRAAWLITRRR